MKKILIIQGNPKLGSLCCSLADKYQTLALQAGCDVERVNLIDLKFDPVLRGGFNDEQSLEPDLIRIQNKILNSDHLVWIYPNWWGGPPAILKGFIDRTFLPGFAFKYIEGQSFPEKLLKNKTAEIIHTMDTPIWYYKWFLLAPGIKIMKSGILKFCGFKISKTTLIGPVRGASKEKRQKWLNQISVETNGPKVEIKPPRIFAITFFLGIICHYFFDFRLSIPNVYRIPTGIVIISLSGLIQLSSLKIFKKNGRKPTPKIESTDLFVSGPYRFSRNPMYLSLVLLQLGIGIIINNLWVSCFSFLALLIIHFFAVLPEEDYLKNKFGEAYLTYKKSVRRYI